MEVNYDDNKINIQASNVSQKFSGSNNYIVSAQKPTVVNAAVVGNFRNENELDMLISRINRIEYFLVTEEGLKPFREIPIYGRIATLNSFRLLGEVYFLNLKKI